MPAPIDFYFDFSSPYGYFASTQIDALAAKYKRDVTWRPFLLGPVFAQQGLGDSPFNVNPVKGRYMWRDLARICEAEGLPLKRPTVFPRNSLLAARVALVGDDQGWIAPFSRSVFEAHFGRDAEISDPGALAPLIAGDRIERTGIIIDAKSGVSGAGRAPKLTTLFSECNESLSAYSIGRHRHTPEIDQVLTDVGRKAGGPVEVIFTPITYKIVGFLKRVENEDYYDRDTSFTPFTLKT